MSKKKNKIKKKGGRKKKLIQNKSENSSAYKSNVFKSNELKVKIGSNVEILPFTHIENATLEENVNVGPFSRIRPGSLLA